MKNSKEYFNSDDNVHESHENFKERIKNEKRKTFILKTIQSTKCDDEILTKIYDMLQK